MTNKKKDYQEPTLEVIKIWNKLSLLDATQDGPDPGARQNGHDFGD